VKKTAVMIMVLLLTGGAARADYKVGMEYLKQGQYKRALAEFEADIEVYGSYWYVPAYMAAVCYYKLKDYEAALTRLREAETATEQSQTKVLDLAKIKTLEAQVLVAQGKYKTAISTAEKYIEQAPADDQAKLYFVKGFAENKAGMHSKAVNDLIQATALDPKNEDAFYQLGLAYVKNNNYDSAIKALSKSVQLDPRDVKAVRLLTDVALNRARQLSGNEKTAMYQKVVRWCDTGLKHKPNDKNLMINLGNAHLGAKEYATAINVFENLQRRYPNDPEVLFGLGSAYLGNKQFDKALPVLQQVQSKMSTEPVLYTYIGTAQLALVKNYRDLNGQLRQAQQAVRTLQEGKRKFPGNRGISAKLAEAEKMVASIQKNQEIEQKNREADLANQRKLKERIATLKDRIRKAEELKRKQGVYPKNYEADKKALEQTVAEYEKLYGPLN